MNLQNKLVAVPVAGFASLLLGALTLTAMSTNISEIVEIKNNTKDTYYMYVWDQTHEGRYRPFDNSKDWYYPSDGKWLEIKPGAHLRADDCGMPDGGKSAGMDRTRVIFKKKPEDHKLQGEPGRGLRMNRVGKGGGKDAIIFRDNSTGDIAKEFLVPTEIHQSLNLTISDEKGIQLNQTDAAVSGEAKLTSAMTQIGKAVLEIAPQLLKIAAK